MRDIILITSKNFDISELVSSFVEDGEFRIVTDLNRIFIEKLQGKDFVSVEKTGDVSSYYDDEEGDVFKNAILEPEFYIIRFKDIEFLKLVLSRSFDRSDIYLDNDFGLILPGTQFLAMIKQRPGWDWALD